MPMAYILRERERERERERMAKTLKILRDSTVLILTHEQRNNYVAGVEAVTRRGSPARIAVLKGDPF